MEEGLCICCGYDVTVDGDLSIGNINKKKTVGIGSLFDSLLGDLSNMEDAKDPFDILLDDGGSDWSF